MISEVMAILRYLAVWFSHYDLSLIMLLLLLLVAISMKRLLHNKMYILQSFIHNAIRHCIWGVVCMYGRDVVVEVGWVHYLLFKEFSSGLKWPYRHDGIQVGTLMCQEPEKHITTGLSYWRSDDGWCDSFCLDWGESYKGFNISSLGVCDHHVSIMCLYKLRHALYRGNKSQKLESRPSVACTRTPNSSLGNSYHIPKPVFRMCAPKPIVLTKYVVAKTLLAKPQLMDVKKTEF
jgi:hypothetical protein